MAKKSESKPKFWQRIHGKLITVLLIALVPTILVQVHFFNESYKARKEAELQANLQIARAVAKTFEEFLGKVVQQEYAVGQALASFSLSTEQQRQWIESNKVIYPEFLNLLWVSPGGTILISHLPQIEVQTIADRKYFQDIVLGREWSVSDLQHAKATGEPVIAIARGIRDTEGKLLGVVVASIPSDRLADVLKIERPKGGGHAIVDSRGMLVSRFPWINATWEQRNWIKDYPEFKEALSGREISKTVFAPFEGKNRMVGFVPVQSIGWAASAGRTEEIALEPIVSQLIPQGLLFFVITVAAFGAALLCSRFIGNSVRRLRDHARALGSGDSSNPVVTSGPAELQELADSFNEMAENLRSREISLREQREWLGVTLNSIGDAVIATDTAGAVTFLNPVAAAVTGWQIEEAVGQPIRNIFRIINEQTHEPADDIVGRVLREGCIVALANHTALVTRDGREIPIEDSAAPIRDKDGGVSGAVLVFHDVTEMRRAREQIDSIARFPDENPNPILRISCDGKLLYANRSSAALLKSSGWKPGETLPGDWRQHALQTLSSGCSKEMELTCEDVVYTLLLVPVSELGYLNIYGRDITERKRAEEELRQFNRILRALSNTNQAAIHADDIRNFLDAVCRIVVEECGHPMVWIGFAEDDKNKTVKPTAQAGFEEGYLETIKITWSDTELGRGPTGTAVRTGIPDVCKNMLTESRMRSWRDQAIRRGYASSVALPLKADGQTLGALTIYSKEPDSFSVDEVKLLAELAEDLAYGITFLRLRLAHKQSEQELQESQARLDLALRSAGMGAWNWDITENIRYFDDQAFYLLGIDPTTFTGAAEEFFAVVHPDDRDTVMKALTRTLEHDAPYETEYRAIWPDRSVHYITARGKLVRDDNGLSVRLNGLVWDISERKLMEEELRKSRDELELRVQERTAELSTTIERLELLNRELQEFAYVASHDLQEPLRKIQTFCGMAKKRCDPILDTTSQEYLDRVLNSASRMRQLLRDLLKFSRVATRPEPFKEIDMVNITREAGNVFEATIEETGCKLEIQNLPAIEADESQMLQLFQNLIGNALKFRGREKPLIKVYGKLDGKGVHEIYVEDNGIGFDQQFAELIFKPFERLHKRSEYVGTGIGLSICRKIVERHGGNIRAESEPGKGSKFILRLPVKQTRVESIHSAGQRS